MQLFQNTECGKVQFPQTDEYETDSIPSASREHNLRVVFDVDSVSVTSKNSLRLVEGKAQQMTQRVNRG